MSVAGVVTRGAAAIVPRLSFPLASGLGRALGAVAWALDGRHRRVAVDNLAVAFPAMPEAQRQRLALRAFQQSGRTAVEMLWSASLDDRTLADVAVFEGVRHIDEALAAGSGALITTAHFGNWELMGVALAHIGIPMNVIARRVDDDQVEEVLHGLRERTGARVIHKQEAVRAALRALRDNKVVGVLIDQNTIPGRGAFVPFFGRLAATTEIASQLHVRTGAPIVMLFCIPEGDRYRFVFEPLVHPPPNADRDRAVRQLTAAATRHIEDRIRRCPEAWLWIHDRWRTRPPADHQGATP